MATSPSPNSRDDEFQRPHRSGPLLVALVASGVVGVSLAVFGFTLVSNHLLAPIELPEQTSPDGSWSVKLIGKPTWAGAIEITATSDTSGGASHGPYVVGLANSADEFRAKFSSLSFRDNQALADGRPILTRPSN